MTSAVRPDLSQTGCPPEAATEPPRQDALSPLLVQLLKGVLYQDADPRLWGALIELQARVRDYVAVLCLELMVDEAEGYAFLRSRRDEERAAGEAGDEIPRLIARRPLSFPVSLLLALLRKKLAEFDATGGETRLVLSREEILELVRVFLPDSSNEAKLIDQIERHLNKAAAPSRWPCATRTATRSSSDSFTTRATTRR